MLFQKVRSIFIPRSQSDYLFLPPYAPIGVASGEGIVSRGGISYLRNLMRQVHMTIFMLPLVPGHVKCDGKQRD